MKPYINPYILKLIEEAIFDEVSDHALYTALAKKCTNLSDMFTEIASDELKHKKMLTELYTDLSGKQAVIKKADVPDLSQDCESIIKAQVPKELEGAALYRTLYFALPQTRDKNIIFEIMTDEMMHATRLSGQV